jgi:aminoglycoside phosphotransferase (APT) family kinase protein
VKSPGALLAQGRDSDIFECGEGLVLRRSRRGRSMAIEARTMEYARTHSFPVPAIDEISADGTDLVMERLDGPSMVEGLSRKPWTIRQQGRVLGDLHRKLHAIPAPDWLADAPSGSGSSLLHLDLHPLNVIITANGPVVIDWPNARRGDGNTDVALTWILVAAGEMPAGRVQATVSRWARAVLINGLLAQVDRAAVSAELRDVVEWKVKDPNMSTAEQEVMWAMAREHAPSQGGTT